MVEQLGKCIIIGFHKTVDDNIANYSLKIKSFTNNQNYEFSLDNLSIETLKKSSWFKNAEEKTPRAYATKDVIFVPTRDIYSSNQYSIESYKINNIEIAENKAGNTSIIYKYDDECWDGYECELNIHELIKLFLCASGD